MKIKVFIQIRTNSSRLPKKCFKEISGLKIFEIVYFRAVSERYETIVLTSNQKSDDHLISNCLEKNIKFFRGDLNNVLSRFYEASWGLYDNDIIVRLTGDNIVPDSYLINKCLDYFQEKNLDFLTIDSSSAPYGVSLEIFSYHCLKSAYLNAKDEFDLEHVTPYIKRHFNVTNYRLEDCVKYNSLRVTLDTEDDFSFLKDNLMHLKDYELLNLPYNELLEVLFQNAKCNFFQNRVLLGGAQIGLDYGLTRKIKLENKAKVESFSKIFNLVWGVDTAKAYGVSEFVLSSNISKNKVLKIISKFSPFENSIEFNEFIKMISSEIYESNSYFGDNLFGILFHRTDNLLKLGASEFLLLKKKNSSIKFGVSIQSPDDYLRLKEAQLINLLDIVQIPMNILDYRWHISGILPELRDFKGLICLRSVFLQGVLIESDTNYWPILKDKYDPKQIQFLLNKFSNEMNFSSLLDLCFSFSISIFNNHKVIVGVQDFGQFEEIRKQVSLKKISQLEYENFFNQSKDVVPQDLLDPTKWRNK